MKKKGKRGIENVIQKKNHVNTEIQWVFDKYERVRFALSVKWIF